MKRDYIDFHEVSEAHGVIHARLQNWARSLFSKVGNTAGPMFRGYQSPASVKREMETPNPVDQGDARKIAAAVYQLPDKQRKATHWSYVQKSSPTAGRRYVGCTFEELQRYVVEARQMMVNRGV